MTTFAVHVPATIANLGPGFDCLGLALDLWNTTCFSLEGEGARVEVAGFGEGALPTGPENLVARCALETFATVGAAPPRGLRIRSVHRFPLGSGLGSSSAAVVTGVLGANALLGFPLGPESQLVLAAKIEGHPDNAAPALFGGLNLVAYDGTRVLHRVVDIPRVVAAVVVPEIDLLTRTLRAVLPKTVPMTDAVFSMGRAALVVEALRTGDLALLGEAMEDRLHQPYRIGLIPGAQQAIRAAREAGAAASALSGAGPGVVAFAENEAAARKAAAAMAEAFAAAGVGCWQWVGESSPRGAQAEELTSPRLI